MTWCASLLVLTALLAAEESPEKALRQLSDQCYPAQGPAAVPRLGHWLPSDGPAQAWDRLVVYRSAHPSWPRDEALQRRWHLVDGALHGSDRHSIDQWLLLLPTVGERIDLARLLIADGRWREANDLLNAIPLAQLMADSRRRSQWREAWACLVDLDKAARAWPWPVLDQPQITLPTWDRGLAAWLRQRTLPVPSDAAHWSLMAQAEATRGGDVQCLVDNRELLVAPMRPGLLRWEWRVLESPADDFDPAWLDRAVVAAGRSADGRAVALTMPDIAAEALLLTANLEDGSTLAWAIVEPRPLQIHAWCIGDHLAVVVADLREDRIIPAPPVQVLANGTPLTGGHHEQDTWLQPLSGLPADATFEIRCGRTTISFARRPSPPPPWKLSAWWSRPLCGTAEPLGLAGCLRLEDWTAPGAVPGSDGSVPMQLIGFHDQVLDLGSIAIDADGCFSAEMLAPDWIADVRQLRVGDQLLSLPSPSDYSQVMEQLDIVEEVEPTPTMPRQVRWQADVLPTFEWRPNLQPDIKDDDPLRDLLGERACAVWRSDQHQLIAGSTSGVPSVPDELPDGHWDWHTATFAHGRWIITNSSSRRRPLDSQLTCSVEATTKAIVIRVTDANGHAVDDARVTVRLNERHDSQPNEGLIYRDLFSGRTWSGSDYSTHQIAIGRRGVVQRRVTASAIRHRLEPEQGSFQLRDNHRDRRFGRCGGCRMRCFQQEALTADDPLALWQAWQRTADDGVLRFNYRWPTPAPETLTINVIAVRGNAVGQVSGTITLDRQTWE